MFLWDALNFESLLVPIRADKFATAVGGGFFEAGRFGGDELAEGGDHVRERGFQQLVDFLGEEWSRHCANMLTIA